MHQEKLMSVKSQPSKCVSFWHNESQKFSTSGRNHSMCDSSKTVPLEWFLQ